MHYALEGSIAITGALVQWMRDNLGLIRTSSEIETLARRWQTMAACTSFLLFPACLPLTGRPMRAE